LVERYKEKEVRESKFAKEAMSKSVYEDKPKPVLPPVDPNIDQEELEYLKGLNFVSWIMYPFIKTGFMILTCKRRKQKVN